mmetsp:Transcript_5153/g.9791  ORF Transcript_5153/g.9791 Transcript_5153/m.9791 type:complete len:1612 (+) Transcript_5153:450-5285(+)|eukprot:CAMPEP_0176493150 /NCGR_PEP_ID=MMETSP0200_2-20121128/9400_1 /TAXON_ID=947934 /ORGANISM="Chaetoceros sp., Strain GSL56" /LENGTH=1611 /DNA_ID=CAMNT_0017890803 /DNA_START=356 /DNA_END=5191 /DNA_ORIENTATION=-
MPTFRRSPRRLRHNQRKEEDGSFNFQPDAVNTTTVSDAVVTATGSSDIYKINKSSSYNHSDYDNDDSTDGDGDDNSYKRRFFRSSPKKKNRKSLQNQEKVSGVTSKKGNMLSFDDGSISHVIEKEFVPFHTMKHSYPKVLEPVNSFQRSGKDSNDNDESKPSSPREQLGISARKSSGNANYHEHEDTDEGDNDYTDDNGGDETDDDESLRSKNSLKISAMNKAKRREFIKQHLKQESRKEGVVSAFETNIQPSSSFTASSHLILPPRIETATETFETFRQVGGDHQQSDSDYMDPWAPHVTSDDGKVVGSNDKMFDFPSDPFAEFDAQHAIDVQKEKISGSIHVVNKVFGFTPTRKGIKSRAGVVPKRGERDESKSENVNDSMGPVLRPSSPLLHHDDMDTTRDSSEIAIAPPPLDQQIRHHKKKDADRNSLPVVKLKSSTNKYPPTKTTRRKNLLYDRPMNDVSFPTSSEESISSSIGESSEACPSLHLVHIEDFMKLDEADRLQAYSDLFALAADTMKDVDDKRQEIQHMNSKVDDLVKRVTEMEIDRESFEKKNEIAKKEILHMRGIIKSNGTGMSKTGNLSAVSSMATLPDELTMLKSELESKDIIIEALKNSIEEWKNQEQHTKQALDKFTVSNIDIGEKPSYTKAEVGILRKRLMQAHENVVKDYEARIAEVKRKCDEVVAEKESKLKYQSSLIEQQKTVIVEARQEIQEKERLINDLRTGVSRKETTTFLPDHKNSSNSNTGEERDRNDTDDFFQPNQTHSSRVLDVNIPAGTVKARVAMAASRAMKNASMVSGYSPFSRTKDSQDSQQKSNKGQQLDERDEHIEKSRIALESEISKLTTEKNGCIELLEQEKEKLALELNKVTKEKENAECQIKELLKIQREQIDTIEEQKVGIEKKLMNLGLEDLSELGKFIDENDQLRAEISVLNQQLANNIPRKRTKEDENKFADIEDNYKAEIEGLISEKEELQNKIYLIEISHKEVLQTLTQEKEEYKRMYHELQVTHDEEMSILMTQKNIFEKQISDLKTRLADIEHQKVSKVSVSDMSNLDIQDDEEILNHEVGEATCETETNANGSNKAGLQELDDMMKQNQLLSQKVRSLEDEIETVSGLLEETIMSIKEKDDEIEALRDGSNNGKGVLGILGGQGAKGTEQKKVKNFSHYTDEEIKQLERICKLHQLTIIRQRSQAKAMKMELDEALTQVEKYKAEIKVNEEKVSVLESQFADLNKTTKKNPETTVDTTSDCADDTRCSIVKVDAAYLSSLEHAASKDKATIEGLLNEKRILKERILSMKEHLNVESILRAKVDDLSSSLEARDLELKHLEEAYKARRSIVQRPVCGLSGGVENAYEMYDHDECTVDELKEIIAHRDKMVAQLKTQITHLEQSLKTAGPRGAIINLRRVSLLQEMQDSIIRRLNVLITRLDDDDDTGENCEKEFLSPSKPFLISMTDKLSLLHDYQKISLHLIEIRLSNEIESLRSERETVELDEEVVARFERTLETLDSTKNEIDSILEGFNSELHQHNIKLAAKNGLIENLLSKDRERRSAIEGLEKELEILKSLSEYQSINIGVMARFKECANLEEQLKEKEMVIKRLNDVIEEYRYENQ